MVNAESNGNPLQNTFPKRVMVDHAIVDVMSSDPANARRHLPGQGGVKYATGHVGVAHQALRGNYATGVAHRDKISARCPHRIGTWNVRGLNQPGKLRIVEKEMERKKVHILGLSETKWRKSGHFVTESGNKVYFSGPENESSNGVAFIVPQQLDKCVVGYKPVNDRIITIKLNASPCCINIVQVYAPTSLSTEEEIEQFYSILVQTLEDIPKREVTLVVGDFNAKVGHTVDDDHLRRIVGKYGIGERNDRGERLLQFCSEENLAISNTCFEHHIRRLYTWISPGDRYRNQIDYILVQSRWRSSILNATTLPGADCGSDHQLLVAVLRIRFKKLQKPRLTPDLRKVDYHGFRQTFKDKIQDPKYSESSWPDLKEVIIESAKENALRTIRMKDFIAKDTEGAITERRMLKERGLLSESDRQRYSELNTEVQRLCRRDKTAQINKICDELEQQSVKHETKDLFQKVKDLTRSRTFKTCAIKNEEGIILTEINKVLCRWNQYCSSLYEDVSTDLRVMPLNIQEKEPDILPMEIERAIKSLKPGKSPGKDGVPAELLKNCGHEGMKILTKICNIIWNSGQWPEDWTESVFIPLHKKDLPPNVVTTEL